MFFLSEAFPELQDQDSHTLFWAPEGRGAVFCFRLLVPLAVLSPLFDASSPRTTRLSQVFCSHSFVPRSLFLRMRPHILSARNAPSPSGLTMGL